MNSKNEIIESIHNPLYFNIYCPDKNPERGWQGYKNRVIGFRSEIDFLVNSMQWFPDSNYTPFDGGYIIPRHKSPENIYITISPDQPDSYTELYSKMLNHNMKKMFFIHYSMEEIISTSRRTDISCVGVPVISPAMKVYEYDHENRIFKSCGTDYYGFVDQYFKIRKPVKACYSLEDPDYIYKMLGEYDIKFLSTILANRYFFDGVIGLKYSKGISCDIDAIIKRLEDNEYRIYEIKEKDLSKTPPFGFGMDLRRAEDLTALSISTGIPAIYVVKHIENQITRKCTGWKWIRMDDFMKFSSPAHHGGIGMATVISKRPETLVAPEKFFKPLK